MSNHWMGEAACRDADPELFFPPRSGMSLAVHALNICSTCPVIAECRTYRESLKAEFGIWHGKQFRSKVRDW